jgi:hypothetical protein
MSVTWVGIQIISETKIPPRQQQRHGYGGGFPWSSRSWPLQLVSEGRTVNKRPSEWSTEKGSIRKMDKWTRSSWLLVHDNAPAHRWLLWIIRHIPRIFLVSATEKCSETTMKLKLIYDRHSVGQPVLVSGAHLGPANNFSFSLKFPSDSWGFAIVAPSLTRGRVCNLLVQLLSGLARAVTLGSKSLRTHGHILLSHLRLPQLGRPGSRIYIPQEQGGPVISPGTGFPFCRLLRLAGLRWRYSNPPPHRVDNDQASAEVIASLTESPIHKRLSRYWPHDLLTRF